MRDRLRVVSTELPPRPGDPLSSTPKRRAVSLLAPPGPSTAAIALAEACKIFDGVLAGTWQWPDPHAPLAGDPGRLAPAALRRVCTQFHAVVVGEHVSERTWQRTYAPYLKRLQSVAAQQAWLEDVNLLDATLRRWPPNSRARQMAHDRIRALWKQAGWPWPEAILLKRGNGRAAANPDGVLAFSDQEITELRRRVQSSRLSPADLVAWDCLSCFGLRPVELKGLELRRVEGVLVAVVSHEKRNRRGKSGARTVPVVPPTGWPADCHGLLERWQDHGIPSFVALMPSPGERMARQLQRLQGQQGATGAIRVELTPYGLRHAFALRLGVDLGLSVREAAELMGHSPTVHLQAYGRQLDRPRLLAKVAELISR